MLNDRPLVVELFAGTFGWSAGCLAHGCRSIGFDIEHLPHHGEVPVGAELVLQDVLTLHGSQFKNADLILASPPCTRYSYLAMPWSRSTDPNNSKAAKALRKEWETNGPDNRLFDACFRIQQEAIAATAQPCMSCGGKAFVIWGAGDTRPCERCDMRGLMYRHIPLIVENVRGAQPWVGKAKAKYGSFYLWGDVEQIGNRIQVGPDIGKFGAGLRLPARELKGYGSTWFGIQNNGERYDQREVNPVSGIKAGHPERSYRNGHKSTPHLTNAAEHGKHGSRSNARKAASAQIAKIPFALSSYVAQALKIGKS